MDLFFEKYYPFIISIITCCVSYTIGEIFCFEYDKFFNTSLSIFSILIGFLLTVSTIINSLDNEAIDFIKKSDKYHLFIDYLKKAIHTSLNSLLMVVFYILLKDSFSKIIISVNNLLIMYITLSLLNCYRFIKVFIKIIVR